MRRPAIPTLARIPDKRIMKAMKMRSFFVIVLAVSFCPIPAAFSGMANIPRICLTECTQVPSEIEKYTKMHPIKTERDEINYLLYRIRTSHVKFIRNGSEFDAAKAAAFLRWKIAWYQQRHGEKIDNDEKFVAKILKGSETTGEPYRVLFPDGKRVNMQLVMLNEYYCLEAYQGDTPEISASDLHLR
jgi:hypothetical protein